MLFLLDGTPGSDILCFLTRLQEETLSCTVMLYDQWIKQASCHQRQLACDDFHDDHPEGIILMRVLPEIAHKRLQKSEPQTNITLDYIQHIFAEKDLFYIQNQNNPQELHNLPVLVLNGNTDFKTDFAQFYNHLFYIRRFIKQIEERKEIALGIHKEKAPQRKCC
jgi:hypothetical protein